MKLFRTVATTVSLTLGLIASAQSAVIFSDNFDTENGGVGKLNYKNFSKWTVTSGTVDLIGNGFFDFLPGNGLYVDLDGSTRNAGIMGHFESLVTGNYTLSFSLAGNQRNNAAETTDVGVSILGGSILAQQNYSLNRRDGFTNYSINFSINAQQTPAPVQITFGARSNDNIGMLLDNVVLEQHTTQVAEPAGLALFGLSLLGLAASRRFKA